MTSTVTHPALEAIRGRLVVSCQAYPGEPMRDPDTMCRMAQAVAAGGAAGIRAQGLEDLRRIRAALDLPLIGLWKDGDGDVFITPTLGHALAVAATGADIVALDGTRRPRPDGRTLARTIKAVHKRTGRLVMADVSTREEGLAAAEAGADVIGTTLAGYTPYSRRAGGTSSEVSQAPPGPDLDLVAELAGELPVPLIAEGRYHTPEQAAEAVRLGAHAVVVGTAITHPATITRWFATAVTRRG
ncbi:N-acetylmannosamine-6-phosphate 2-epimerase [Nonomuraea gerenzanensis]|uniref:Putative N-acetylmannosamine-6-phosphate 2-epimerase n=1 Tax=Nonomuraea gerenzanensis TaxID=93944 RepID=A0A1M4DVK1_9ACTN|nr:N-acetylmannosamine-6-phosphate 2-epimerase [Nonomuraea gerenzanensis]UBU12976.1 N-acetylmannosamine-6-phosphate 2-epimerase [Nonomuraea gerenzanensis]SBO90614.1 N-acetylmannosamine-6-phosphate 2-epimerase [Nonomuraea gerenzanensis]